MSRQWQEYSRRLKEVLGLSNHPVGVICRQEDNSLPAQPRLRICRAILDASLGKTLRINKTNNGCFGASWHLGFHKIDDPHTLALIKQFVVEGEKLFSSYAALERLISQMEPPPDNKKTTFVLGPLEELSEEPQLVIFIVDAEGACRLLSLVVFLDGQMPQIKIGGPTCRLAIIYPLVKEEVNLSFYDYTARKMCNVEKDKLLVSIPYRRIPAIVESLERCSAGKAAIEFPAQFRQFLKGRLTGEN